jgi:hypothetical protein
MQATVGKQDIADKLYEQRTTQTLNQQKLKMQQLDDDRSYWLKMQAFYLSQGKAKLAADAAKRANHAEQRYTNESMGRDVNGNVLPSYVELPNGTLMKRSDWNSAQRTKQSKASAARREKRYENKDKGLDINGNPLPGYKRLPNGKVVKVGGSKAGGITPTAKADILQGVVGQEDDIVKALPTIAKTAGLDALLTFNGPFTPAQRAQLKRVTSAVTKELWARYSARAITPESKKALRSMIARLIKQYTPTSSGGGLLEGLGY